jgi:transcriptional regulator with XRE-family HTH domain
MGKEELLDSRVKAIKANIERILTAKKQTKLWLAEQCNGKSSGWMTHILSGRSKIKMEDINLIAQALGCTTTDLMASEDDPLAPLIQDIRGLPEKYRTQLEALIEVFKKAP